VASRHDVSLPEEKPTIEQKVEIMKGPSCNCSPHQGPHTVGDPGCVVEIRYETRGPSDYSVPAAVQGQAMIEEIVTNSRGPSDECRPSAPCAACAVRLGTDRERPSLRQLLFTHRAMATVSPELITDLLHEIQPMLGEPTEHAPTIRLGAGGELLPEHPFDPGADYLVSGAVIQTWIDQTNENRRLLAAAHTALGDDDDEWCDDDDSDGPQNDPGNIAHDH